MDKYLLSVTAASVLLITFFSFSYAQEDTRSIIETSPPSIEPIPIENTRVEFLQKHLKTHNKSKDPGVTKKVFLSPDREYIAVTELRSKEEIVTYITNKDGDQVTDSENGSFVSWSPDSSKALLFLADDVNEYGREIYYLSVNGTYENSGLPAGVISADISPANGSVIFSVTDAGSDISTVYLREGKGRDEVILEDDSTIITWLRWSPDGSKISYLESDLAIRADEQEIKVMDIGTQELHTVSKVNWGFPPVWSKDSNKILFTYKSDILEFSVQESILEKKSDLSTGIAFHPQYSEEEDFIVFSRLMSTGKEIWLINNSATSSISSTGVNGDYPIILNP